MSGIPKRLQGLTAAVHEHSRNNGGWFGLSVIIPWENFSGEEEISKFPCARIFIVLVLFARVISSRLCSLALFVGALALCGYGE